MIAQQKVSLLTYFNPLSLVRNLWHHKGLCVQFVRREIAQRYKGSYLGIFWSFVSPAVMLSAYTFVFSVVLKARWVGINNSASVGEFALTLFAGLIPFSLFSEVLNRSPGLILAVPNYVKKVVFPLEILPLVAVGSALVHSLISVGVLLCANLILAKYISPTFILLPLAYIPLVLFSLAVGWFFASLGVYVRDIGPAVGIGSQVLFFMSPVVYPVEAVPENLRFVLYINPLTAVLACFRQVTLWGSWLSWASWAGWTAISAAAAVVAYGWFMKTKKGFADVM